MCYKLTTPCKNCPFRTDIRPFLTKGRAREISAALVRGEFHCHKTLDYTDADSETEARRTGATQHCTGALIMLEHMERPSQMMRIAERIGLYDRTKLDMEAPVFRSTDEFIRAQGR